jgi:hypothetical protein
VRFPATVALVAVFSGCDDRPHGEQAAAPRPQPTTKPWPTTQEFLAMPRKPTPLVFMPITLSIPDGWKLDPPDAPTSLEGPAPSGNLDISISILAPMKKARVDLLVEGAHQEAKLKPSVVVDEPAPINGLRALEKFSYANSSAGSATQPSSTQPSVALSMADQSSAQSDTVQESAIKDATAPTPVALPATRPAGDGALPTSMAGQTVSWNLILFVPYEDRFVPCSFDLIGLTQQQFQGDRAFIWSMLQTAVPSKDMDPTTF